MATWRLMSSRAVTMVLSTGTALFVMYKSPFGSSASGGIPTRVHANVQPVRSPYTEPPMDRVERKVSQ